MRTSYEYIVIGCGGIGSAVVYWLARAAGKEVLGLEQFGLGHDKGGSQDHSRIIRLTYHDPIYTALTRDTYAAWHTVEEESGVQLVYTTGGLDLGPADEAGMKAIGDYAAAMRAANIPFEELNAREVMERWPQFRLDDDMIGLFQADAGLVDPRKANATHIIVACAYGATVLDHTPVTGLRPLANGVEVITPTGTFSARRVVVAAASWTNNVLRHVGVAIPITVMQEQVTYFQTPQLRQFAPDRFPIWIWHGQGRNCFYGFPVYGEVATKAGQDLGGDVVTPETRTFTPNPRSYDDLCRFLEQRIPGFLGPELYTKTCLYDLPPDRNFIVDVLPEYPQIAVVQGAAHGFKFACLLGKIMSELVTEGKTQYPIAPFTLMRDALLNPAYPLAFNI